MGSRNREHAMRILMVALGLSAGLGVARAQQPALPTPVLDAQPAPVAAVEPPPEAPVTPPKVICSGTEITISANNSTLSSVLNEVHKCLGTHIDIPSEAGAKRMFDKIGPGKASQVLDMLLSNTGYNYVIGSSPSDEDKIESIVLLTRTGNDATTTAVAEDGRAGSTSRRAFLQMHQASLPHPMTDEDAAAAAELRKAKETTVTPADNPAAPADGQPAAEPSQSPVPVPDAPATTAPAPTQPAANNTFSTKPASTEEQIVNMQQMFELRKQMNQQPPAPNPNQPQP